MASRAAILATSLRASMIGAILERCQEVQFKDLASLKRWFVQTSATEMLPAMREEAIEDPLLATAAHGSLTAVMILLDASLREGHSVGEFVELLQAQLIMKK